MLQERSIALCKILNDEADQRSLEHFKEMIEAIDGLSGRFWNSGSDALQPVLTKVLETAEKAGAYQRDLLRYIRYVASTMPKS
jgi:hypothetical protein